MCLGDENSGYSCVLLSLLTSQNSTQNSKQFLLTLEMDQLSYYANFLSFYKLFDWFVVIVWTLDEILSLRNDIYFWGSWHSHACDVGMPFSHATE